MIYKQKASKVFYVIFFLIFTITGYSQQQNNFYNINLQLKIPEKFYDICFSDSLTGWIGGGHGLVLKTTNGGIDWEKIELGINSDIKKIEFKNSESGWLYAKDTCLKTTNGGKTWFGFTKNFYGSMHFYDDTHGWAANSRTIYRTENGGKNWSYALIFIDDVKLIHFFTPDSGYCLGGIIGQSGDGGKRWSYMGPGMEIRGAHYFSNNEIWIVDGYGRINKVTRFNKRQTYESGTTQPLNDIHLHDHFNGYIVGNRGTILKAQDSITVWNTIPRLTYNDLYSVFLNDSDNVWIGGEEVIFTNHTGIFAYNSIKDTIVKYNTSLTFEFSAKGIPAPVYHLIEHPEGMKIDSISGLIEWTADTSGSHQVVIEAINQFKTVADTFNVIVEALSDVDNELTETPEEFSITAYPNPFNPATTLEYKIAEEGNLSLKIFNSNGEEIIELVNEHKLPGTYQVQFNAENLASGTYYCTLTTNGHTKTKKLMYLK